MKPISFFVKTFLKGLKEDFDIIYATTYFHALPGILLKILKKTPLIVNIQDLGVLENKREITIIKLLKILIHKIVIEFSDYIIAPSEISKRQIEAVFQLKSKSIEVIPNSFNKKLFHPNIKRNLIRRKLKINKNSKIILAVGTLPKKGIEYIVDACGLLKNKYNFKDFYLIIVGGRDHRFSKYYEKIDDIIKKHGIEENVKFVGSISQKFLPFYYKDSDVYVAASYYGDGFGIPCIEASAVGKPIVATELFEKAGTVIKNKTGLIVRPEDSRDLAKNLMKILRNEKLRKKLGRNGIKFSKKFDWDEHCKRLKDIIEKLMV